MIFFWCLREPESLDVLVEFVYEQDFRMPRQIFGINSLVDFTKRDQNNPMTPIQSVDDFDT